MNGARAALLLGGVWLCARWVAAHDLDKYPYRVSPTVMQQLVPDKNAAAFLQSGVIKSLIVAVPLTEQNRSTASVVGVLLGVDKSADLPVSLELSAQVDRGELSMLRSPPELKRLIDQWRRSYRAPRALKKLAPRVQNVVYHDEQGFVFEYQLSAGFDYVFLFEAAVSSTTLRLQERPQDLKTIQRFIPALENTAKYHSILAEKNPDAVIYLLIENGQARCHLFAHDILWDPKTGAWQDRQ